MIELTENNTIEDDIIEYIDEAGTATNDVEIEEEPVTDNENFYDPEEDKTITFEEKKIETSGDSLISSHILILFIDTVVPPLITLAVNRLMQKKGVKISPRKLKLLESEKKQIQPLLDEVIKQAKVKANPMALLVVALVGVYAMKTMTLISLAEIDSKGGKKNG